MKRTLVATLLAAAFAAPVMAQTAAAPAEAPAAEAAPAPALTGNLGLFSSYRFRGISQTYDQPALQGGVDYAHESGLYVGNWNSNVSSGAGFPDGNLEMDFYGGYKHAFGDFGLDVGGIYYYYPGSEAKVLGPNAKSGNVYNAELYVGGSWKFLSLKYFYSLDNYFSLVGIDSTGTATGQNTKGSSYIDLSANYDLGNGWGVNAHYGNANVKNVYNGDYSDWKLGVTKDISGWVIGASYIDTNAHGTCGATTYQPYCFSKSNSSSNGSLQTSSSFKDVGKGIAVVSLSKSF